MFNLALVILICTETGTDTSNSALEEAEADRKTKPPQADLESAEAILLLVDYFAEAVGANQSANACASVGVPKPVTSSQPTPTFI
jgi:hypothetical protein